jgi:hypothetical protein
MKQASRHASLGNHQGMFGNPIMSMISHTGYKSADSPIETCIPQTQSLHRSPCHSQD